MQYDIILKNNDINSNIINNNYNGENKMKKNYKRIISKSGFTLVEIVLVLVILGGLAIVTMQTFNDTDDTSKAQAEIQNLQSLTASIKQMFRTQGTYSGLANDVVTTSVSFPEQMKIVGSPSLVKHSWLSDGLDITPYTQSTTNDSFSILYKEVPASACTAIVSGVYRNFDNTKVGAKDITKYSTTAVKDISAACGVSDTGDSSVNVEFIGR